MSELVHVEVALLKIKKIEVSNGPTRSGTGWNKPYLAQAET